MGSHPEMGTKPQRVGFVEAGAPSRGGGRRRAHGGRQRREVCGGELALRGGRRHERLVEHEGAAEELREGQSSRRSALSPAAAPSASAAGLKAKQR
eukprot:SAG11_NODE_2519_length_3263_cov_5.689001_4_plen_96_part_00